MSANVKLVGILWEICTHLLFINAWCCGHSLPSNQQQPPWVFAGSMTSRLQSVPTKLKSFFSTDKIPGNIGTYKSCVFVWLVLYLWVPDRVWENKFGANYSYLDITCAPTCTSKRLNVLRDTSWILENMNHLSKVAFITGDLMKGTDGWKDHRDKKDGKPVWKRKILL